MQITAGILIGGASRRMGRDKALLPTEGGTLLHRTVAVARAAADEVVLLGTPRFDVPTDLASLPFIADIHTGIGPMGGLEALLAARPHNAVLLLACDMPHITAELLRRLRPVNEIDAVVFADVGGRRHPCGALYSPSAKAVVSEQISHGRFAMMDLLDRLRVRVISLLNDESPLLLNVNRPQDLV